MEDMKNIICNVLSYLLLMLIACVIGGLLGYFIKWPYGFILACVAGFIAGINIEKIMNLVSRLT